MKPAVECVLKDQISLLIRPAIEQDAEDIIAYIQSVSRESDNLSFGAGEFNITAEEERKTIKEFNNSDNQIFAVGIIDNKIVSVLSFKAGGRKRVAHVGEFGITVLKDYWRIGIGRAMLGYLIEWAKSTGQIRKINLRARADNTNAISLYKEMGFVQEGIMTRDMCIDGHFFDCVFMGLQID